MKKDNKLLTEGATVVAYRQILVMKGYIKDEWIDFNGHLGDSIYPDLFSQAVGVMMDKIGLNEAGRNELSYTLFVVESHLCFLKEILAGEKFTIHLQLIDYSDKLLHVFLEMNNEQGERIATNEQMLIGINLNERKSAPFPMGVKLLIEKELIQINENANLPPEVGRHIGIRRNVKRQ